MDFDMSDGRRAHRKFGTAPKIWVHVACNDPDNGSFAGRAVAFHIAAPEEHLDIEGADRKFTETNDFIRVFRLKIQFDRSKTWIGNWCWNAYRISIDDAAKLLQHAMVAGFSCSGASGNAACDLSDRLDRGDVAQIRDGLLRMAIARYPKKNDGAANAAEI